jgi:outer membrane protein
MTRLRSANDSLTCIQGLAARGESHVCPSQGRGFSPAVPTRSPRPVGNVGASFALRHAHGSTLLTVPERSRREGRERSRTAAGLKPRPSKAWPNAFRHGLLALLTTFFCLGAPTLRAQTQGTQTSDPPHPVQLERPQGPGGVSAPVTITWRDALERARQNDAQYLSAVTEARSAHQNRIQARASLLPSVSTTTQELLTTGNGVFSTGRFVTNDGVHVYRAWGVFHQDLSPSTFMMTGYRKASAAEALAQAQEEIARRGLAVTVTQDYYDLVVSQRKYATAQQSLEQAERFLEITQELERGGAAAHSDVIKAQLQLEQQQQAFDEAGLAMEKARLTLAVLLSPTLNENFTVVDDLDQAPALPPFADAQAMVARSSPDLRAAIEASREANVDVSAARASFLPSLTLDTDYGIEANAFALTSRVSVNPLRGRLPNLGQFTTATLNLPVWDWGSLRSKLHQAELRRQQARVELTQTQRELLSNLYSFYNEAEVALSAVESLHRSADLASESVRLNTLRYQAGEALVLEVVDAQNALTQARNSYHDGQERYRVALARLQTLTGSF